MILKIRAAKAKSGWIICSGVREVEYSFERADKAIGYTIEQAEKVCSRHFRSKALTSKQKLEQSNEKRVQWTQVVITFMDGSTAEWLLEVEAYLLNDEGKTIERIC